MTTRRKVRRYNKAALVVCTSIYLVAATSTVDAAASDSLWDSTWGNGLQSGADSSELVLGEDAPTKKKKASKVDAVEEEDDEPWRKKEDWWKDPLSMFDDDDEFIDDTNTQSTAEKEKEARKQAAKEKAKRERKAAEEEMAAMERDAQDRAAKDKLTSQKAAKAQAAKEKAAKEKAAKERAAQEKAERLKAAKGKSEADKVALETTEERQAELKKLVAERVAREQAAKEAEAELKAAKKQQAAEKAAQRKELRAERKLERLAKQMARQKAAEERRAQRELDREIQAASKPARRGFSVPVSFSVPVLQAGLSKLPFLSSPLPALGLVASVIFAKALLTKLSHWKSSQQDNSNLLPPEEDDYPEALMQDTLQYQLDELRYTERYSDMEETDASDVGVDGDGDVDSSSANLYAEHQEQIAKIGTSPASSSPAFFTGLRSALVGGHSRSVDSVSVRGGRRLRVTADELDYLKTVADKAVTERQAMEQEYERTSFQLQEAQSEVTQLASTTKYLKTQLRDYEEMMDRTIRNERKRAKTEIQRMKEVMEASIEQDRESLRKQFTKELARLQAQYEAERARKEAGISELTRHCDNGDEDPDEGGSDITQETNDDGNSASTTSSSPDSEGIKSEEKTHSYFEHKSTKPRKKSRKNKYD